MGSAAFLWCDGGVILPMVWRFFGKNGVVKFTIEW
jgi:hypothetical protein